MNAYLSGIINMNSVQGHSWKFLREGVRKVSFLMLIQWLLDTTEDRKTIQIMEEEENCPNDFWEREGYWRLNISP